VRPGRKFRIGDQAIRLSMLRQALFKSFLSRLDSMETLPPKMEWTTSVGLTY